MTKKALIDTQTSVSHIVSWVETSIGYNAIQEVYPNSCRVCEVVEQPFEVFPTLIWVDCADDVVADQYYYDSSDQTIKPVVDAPYPVVPTE